MSLRQWIVRLEGTSGHSRFRRLWLRCSAAFIALLGTLGVTLTITANRAAASGTARYVAQGGNDTSNDCTAPTNPCATITHAVSQSNSGDTINVAGTIDDHVTIATSLTITQWFNHSQAVVDGTMNGTPFTINSGAVTLNGLTIQNGSASFAGGIFNAGTGTLTVSNSSVNNNKVGVNGSGGGILNNGMLTLTNSSVMNNTTATSGDGAGIYNSGNATVNNSTLQGNTASSFGGGIFNAATGSPGGLTVNRSTFTGNTTGVGGGGIFNSGNAMVNSSTFVNDQTSIGDGGGIYNSDGTATINGSTFTSNVATSGSAVFANNSSLTVLASTISGNSATSSGGGIDVMGGAGVGATIMAGNTGGNCAGTAPASLGYNLTDDSTGTACGMTQSTDKVNANPNLGSLASNGGPTQTLLPPNPSPEAFVIPNPTTLAGTQVCPRIDQRGVPSPSGGACTIGAVEAIPGVAPSLPSGQSHTWTTGQSAPFTVNATGTPVPTITHPYGQPGDGKIPNGLKLSTSLGSATISGTPAANAGGIYNIKLVADNGVGPTSTQTVAVVVQQPPVMSLPKNGGTVGFKAGAASSVPWSVAAPATTWPHISQPVTYTTSGIPMALNFDNNGNGTGTLSGTLAKGTYGPMSITASNVAGSSTTTFSIKAQ